MRLLYTSIICLFLLPHSIESQVLDCVENPSGQTVTLNGNLVSAPVTPGPRNFLNIDDLSIPYTIDVDGRDVSTIFAQNIWLGGTDAAGNILVRDPDYGVSGLEDELIIQGPLNADGIPLAESCGDYNRIWDVRRAEVEFHLADYADNGQIDNPVDRVVGWPGRGNANFSSIYGFELPDQDLAPFMDLDEDGIYEPLDGEYPVEPFSRTIAEHISWEVYHGLNPTSAGSDQGIPVQINQTQWSFYCTDNEIFNTAVFARYDLFYKDPAAELLGFKMGLWTDFDLGCFTDDYIGCNPERNTYFTYNRDNDDNLICEQEVPGFGQNPPTQSVIILNQDLSSFSGIFSAILDPPVELTGPTTATQVWNRLNGLLTDGTPITNVGLGNNEDMGEETLFHWPGNPNNTEEWSMASANIGPLDISTLAVVDFGDLLPGDRVTLDIAYAFHDEAGNDFLDNVELLYQEVDEIQALYDNGFEFMCSPLVCTDDCVWPGDLNNDGIANYVDLIALGFGFSETGPVRDQPIFWVPTPGDSWDGQQVFEDAPDLKHLDGNDDGLVDVEDFGQTLTFYNLTRPDYEPQDFTTPGNEVLLTRTNGDPFETIPLSTLRVGDIRVVSPFSDLRAVTFELEYDPEYFAFFSIGEEDLSDPSSLKYIRAASDSKFEAAVYVEDPEIEQGESYELVSGLRFITVEDPPSFSTAVQFKNIRGWLSDGTEVGLGSQGTVLNLEQPSGLNEPAWANAVNVYPNPVRETLNVSSLERALDQIEVIDNLGRVLTTNRTPQTPMDVSHLPAGIYRLRLTIGSESIYRSFSKME
ncbi:MAG: T9SS type A sorting domain-containing protein [Bacteroidota bacterium]